MEQALRPLGAQISHALKARGVEVVFGIPGVHNIELYRGIEQAGLIHVLARHEQGAGFMADGYARATGRPGVAFVITGPGLTNIMTPMGQAHSDSVPMLVISSCLELVDRQAGRGRLHEMLDQEAAAATVCDWSATAPDAATAWGLIDRALAEFAASRPRPKHIQVPIDVLAAAAAAAPAPLSMPARPRPDPDALAEVARRIRAARRPLFVFGAGTVPGAAAARRLMALAGAACFVTSAGRGVIPGDHPLNFGSTLARPEAAGIVGSADLVVVIGAALGETDMQRRHLGHTAGMIRIDLDPAMLADAHRADLAVLGDAAAAMAGIAGALDGHDPARGWSAAEVAEARGKFLAAADAAYPAIRPLFAALREVLAPDTLIYSDMTQFAYASRAAWDMAVPGCWHHPNGFGTLGYALPAAIGGKIGAGARPVVAIAGDYGFQYTMQELAVAVELNLPLPVLLWDNSKLGAIEDSMIKAQIAPFAVTPRNPDFCRLAEAFGARSAAPANRAELQVAVRAALAADGPTLIRITPGTAA